MFKRHCLTPAVIAFMAISFNVFADDCSKFKALQTQDQLADEGLVCGKDIKSEYHQKLNIKGFKLVAMLQFEDGLNGVFYYEGNRVLNGSISYTDQINDGFLFETKDRSFQLLSNNMTRFKYPKNKVCNDSELTAPAKVRMRLFRETRADSSQASTIPLDYEIISIGKYVCIKDTTKDY